MGDPEKSGKRTLRRRSRGSADDPKRTPNNILCHNLFAQIAKLAGMLALRFLSDIYPV